MVKNLLRSDLKNDYILFGSSLRQQSLLQDFYESLSAAEKKHARLKILPFPPTLLHFMWNVLHIVPVEWLIGSVDIFWSSDWTQPPLVHAKGITTIHDLTIFRYPESFPSSIVSVHKKKLERSKKECIFFFCDSEATKIDAHELLHVPLEHMAVVYPGYSSLI
jgi:hypothetical protein